MVSIVSALQLRHCDLSLREEGSVYFCSRPSGGRYKNKEGQGWVTGIGQDGRARLEIVCTEATQDVHALANGNIIYTEPRSGRITEIDQNGICQARWHARGQWRETEPRSGSIELPISVLHHTVSLMPNDHFLLLSAEARTYTDWHTSTSDVDAPRARVNVVGDVVLEVSRDGVVKNEWRLLDLLDPYRVGHGSLSDNWHKKGFPNSCDWSHANAAKYDPFDDSILVSLRHQDCIVKFSRSTGRLHWILGNHSHWSPSFTQYLLSPTDGLQWPYHQHDCSVTGPNRVMCFDNGNFRASAFQRKQDDREIRSRAVEYEINTDDMSVKEVWSYGDAPAEKIYSCFQGGAQRLAKTGNTLITFGGVCVKDGQPTSDNLNGICRARLIEVSPNKEIVFDLLIDGSKIDRSMPISVFRSEHAAPVHTRVNEQKF